MTENGITYACVDRIATITFDRPERRNAVTNEMRVAYFQALRVADGDPDARAVVVTGAGSAFCAGADFGRLDALAADPDARAAFAADRVPICLPQELAKPIVAAVNGPAVGLGAVYALLADVRLAATSAMFSLPFVRLGLAAEYGVSWLLPRLVGLGNALDLLVSGRTIDSSEAARIGLVQQVVDDEALPAAAAGYARVLADRCSPRSLAIVRRQVYSDLDGGFRTAFDRSLGYMRESFAEGDLAEGIAAWRERREPRFGSYVGGGGSA